MSKLAKVYKLPEKYVIVKDDQVSFASSLYRATNEAINLGATRVENGKWSDLLSHILRRRS